MCFPLTSNNHRGYDEKCRDITSEQMADCTVLVVEDEPLIRVDLVERLAQAGCTTIEAGSAVEAVAVLEEHREITVVFTDVQMPGKMDGIELARYVRERWPPTIVVVSSGKTVPRLPEDIPVLEKPYNERMLESVVAEVQARLSTI